VPARVTVRLPRGPGGHQGRPLYDPMDAPPLVMIRGNGCHRPVFSGLRRSNCHLMGLLWMYSESCSYSLSFRMIRS